MIRKKYDVLEELETYFRDLFIKVEIEYLILQLKELSELIEDKKEIIKNETN